MPRTTKKTTAPIEKHTIPTVPAAEQPYQVPENWRWTRIKYLCSLKNGRAFKPTDWSESGLPIVRIQNLNNPNSDYNYYNGDIDSDNRLYGGELLFAWSGTPGTSFGAHIWQGKDAILNQHIFRVDFDEKKLNKLFYMFAINQRLDMLISAAHGGAGLQHVTKGVFEATPIPLPPLAEQQRIVDRIERLFAKLDEAREKAQAVVDGFENRKAAILHKAFTGELTKKWREERGIGMESWEMVPLNKICERIFDGPFGSNLKSDDYVESGIRVVRLENIKNLWFDDSKQSFVTEQKYKMIENHTVIPTDLIMSTFIADEIKICQMPSYIKFAINKADCVGIRLIQSIYRPYILYFLSSKDTYNFLVKKIHGATRPRVNTKQIKEINIPLASSNEQIKIVQVINNLFTQERRARDLAESVIAQIDGMKKAILARAFRGELGTNVPGEAVCEV